MVESWKWPGRYYLQRWPSARALAPIKAKIREMTDRRYRAMSLDVVLVRLNPVLPGWSGYFRRGNSSWKFNDVDSYVAERMAILASIKYGLSGRNCATRFTYKWFQNLGIYRLTEKVTYRTAHAQQ